MTLCNFSSVTYSHIRPSFSSPSMSSLPLSSPSISSLPLSSPAISAFPWRSVLRTNAQPVMHCIRGDAYVFLVIHGIAPRRDRCSDFHDLYVTWRVSAQRCAFWGSRCYYCRFRGSKAPNPNFWGVKWFFKPTHKMIKPAYYRNRCIDSSQFSHSDKDHQVLFVGGPNTLTTNPIWRTAAILKNRKIAISQQRIDRSWWNFTGWHRFVLSGVPAVKNINVKLQFIQTLTATCSE